MHGCQAGPSPHAGRIGNTVVPGNARNVSKLPLCQLLIWHRPTRLHCCNARQDIGIMAATRDFPPRLIGASVAARYLGLSEATLRKLGIPRREWGSRRLYDKSDLDAFADSLPYERGKAEDTSCADAAFGVVN